MPKYRRRRPFAANRGKVWASRRSRPKRSFRARAGGGIQTQEPMASADSNRARRFTLPDMDDARAEEVIDTFVAGQQRRRGRAALEVASGRRREDPLVRLDNRITWQEALRLESARSERHRRPVSVVILEAEVRPGADDGEASREQLVRPIAHVLWRAARETDHVTRAGDARFLVLLPETAEADAAHFADRIVADCEVWLAATRTPVYFQVTVAAASSDETLEQALARTMTAAALSA
jgi:diguanylate cyclase (GGDEF)-like protein